MKSILILSILFSTLCKGQVLDTITDVYGNKAVFKDARFIEFVGDYKIPGGAQYENTLQPDDKLKAVLIQDGIRIDSFYFNLDTKFIMGDTNGVTLDSIPQIDTIKVFLLMCDTSKWIGNESNEKLVFWNYAYSVRELRNESMDVENPGFWSRGTYKDYWRHLYYLDSDKLPLPKSIIVWQSKEIK